MAATMLPKCHGGGLFSSNYALLLRKQLPPQLYLSQAFYNLAVQYISGLQKLEISLQELFHRHTREVIGAYIGGGGLGITTSYIPESKALVHGIEKAINMGASCIWVESDATTTFKAFQRDNVHWKVRSQWNLVKHKANSILTSTWREVNFVVDHCAKRGETLPEGVNQW
ncbi:hypothetical protein IFM89_032197 [Coptis chinensis]|uniref:RNase H type-1 domain-containing protein n=1 Tax=Coptis chinensis TaxID=261450 RepID=A0A835MBC1_9MAGN|nr:hypothetical protein IFM89_032197 [Coptis chinensis]